MKRPPAVNTAIVAEHQRAVDTMRKLEHSLAHVQEELERERRAREELSSREKKLNEAIAASTTEIALLQSKLGEMEKSRDAMRHAMSQTKEKTLQSVAFRLKNRATSQAWSSWVAMWRDVTAAAPVYWVYSRAGATEECHKVGSRGMRGGKHVQQSATAFVAPWLSGEVSRWPSAGAAGFGWQQSAQRRFASCDKER